MVHTDVVRWAILPVSLAKASSVDDALDCLRGALEEATDTLADGRLLACRFELQGRTEAHENLLAAEDVVLAKARACALGLGDDTAWVEKVVVATEPVAGPEALAERQDAVGELKRMLGEASADRELVRQFEAEIGGLIRTLPHEARDAVEDTVLQKAINDDYEALIAEVMPYLFARLMAEEN